MENRRNFLKKSIAGSLGAAASVQFVNAGGYDQKCIDSINAGSSIKILKKDFYKPLDSVEISTTGEGTLKVLDAQGREYFSTKNKKEVFAASGALGYHVALLTDKSGRATDMAVFKVDCKSEIEDSSGRYKHLLYLLHKSMAYFWWDDFRPIALNEKVYKGYVNTSRDHIHGLKGMKYFYDPLKEWLDIYAENQCENGMVWDFFFQRKGIFYSEFKFPPEFSKILDEGRAVFGRQPVMNDVEYTFIHGIHHTWKITGDDDWMKNKLDGCLKAVEYATTSPYVWSEKFQLLKRTFTIDEWDFQSSFDADVVSKDKNIMLTIPGVSKFGAHMCDNIGMFYACNQLAEMLEYAGRSDEAKMIREKGKGIYERFEKIGWDGEHYINNIPEDPTFKRDFGIDVNKQVTLSNAYALNRGIPHDKAVAIIKTYQRIKEETKDFSPGEWYTSYPPYERGFDTPKWHYVNGGVAPMVAGELAHGAFDHGFEEYGVDILNRVAKLGKQREFIPDVWRGEIPKLPQRKFETVDLRKAANTDIFGSTDPKEAIPWTQEGENDLHEFPTGKNEFEHIPFDIIEPASNNRRVCLGISNKEPYKKTETLVLKKKAASIYILHALSGRKVAGIFEVKYADGTKYEEYIMQGNQIEGWWMPYRKPDMWDFDIKSKIAWTGKNAKSPLIGVIIWGWNNPSPDKIIDSITFTASIDSSRWFILGVTLSDSPVFLMPSGLSGGIPSPWSCGAVVYAMMEGLAGIYNTGTNFSKVKIAPRWTASDEKEATVTAKHETVGGYARYHYRIMNNTISLELATCADEQEIALLLPKECTPGALTVNGKSIQYKTEMIESSRYAVFTLKGIESKKIILPT